MKRDDLKLFLGQLKAPVHVTPTPVKKDASLIMRIAESISDILDFQSSGDFFQERSESYGFTAFSSRIKDNKANPKTKWAMAEYDSLPIKRRAAVDRSMLGAFILKNATCLEHLESYIALVGFSEVEAKEVGFKTVWSTTRNEYVASAASLLLQHTAAIYAYTIMAVAGGDAGLMATDAYKRAVSLHDRLGGIDAHGEPAYFAFNRGWAYAKGVCEVSRAKPRGHVKVKDMIAAMAVDFARLKHSA